MLADEVAWGSVDQARRAARAWLVAKGLAVPGEPTGEVMRRLAGYRQGLARTPRPDRLAWAREIVADYEAGRRVCRMPLKLAVEALGLDGVPMVRRVEPPPARPDRMERQAGDVEAIF